MNSIKKSIERYSKKHIPKPPRKTKSKRPEKEVEKKIMALLRRYDFDCFVVDSKAHMGSNGAYYAQSAKSGVSDIVGVAPNGLGVFIELKAPGRLKTVKDHQLIFLDGKIKRGAFGAVIDSEELFLRLWETFMGYRKNSKAEGYQYLISELPRPVPKEDNSPIF